jgi:hypothetical protein
VAASASSAGTVNKRIDAIKANIIIRTGDEPA